MALRAVVATRYVTPLREGGSLPGLVEADDLGTYVVKFRGAGQGIKTLVAEIVTGELARRLGLPVPELVLTELDGRMANAEPDQEVQDLLRASAGTNLGMDFLPGSLGLEQGTADVVDPDLAARIMWFDGLTQNVDRSWRNPNLLLWHGAPYLIDHGASLYFHHDWSRHESAAIRPYPKPEEHVLRGVAGPLATAHGALAPLVTADLLADATALVPDEWLGDEGFDVRAAYADVLLARVGHPDAWLDAMEAARASR